MFESTQTTSKVNLFGPSEPGSPEWLEWRRQGVTSTDSAKILGVSKYGDALDVYIDKVSGRDKEFTAKQARLLKRGHKMEHLVAEEYSEVTGRKLRRQPPRIHSAGLDWFRCSIDRQALASDDRPTGMVECKTAGQQMFRKIAMEGLPNDYLIQVQHDLAVWDYQWGAIAILCPDTFDFIHFDIERNDELVEQIMEAGARFWKNVQEGTTPETNIKAPKLPAIGGDLVHLDSAEFGDAVQALNVATMLAAEADELKTAAQDRIKAMMLDSGHDVVQGFGKRIYFKEQDGRKSLDKKALLAAHPEVNLALYEVQGAPFRSFRTFDVRGEV